MFLVLYTSFDTPLSEALWNQYFNLIPSSQRSEITRFFQWQDRQACLLGKLLLREGFERMGYSSELIEKLQNNAFKRPFVPAPLDFNLSHSYRYVVSAFTSEGRVGIDIEKIRKIDFGQFSSFFSPEQWDLLKESSFDLGSFFILWTKLESILKWEGSGVYYDIKKIKLFDTFANLEDRRCYFHNITFDPLYPCHLATGVELTNLQVESITFGEQKDD